MKKKKKTFERVFFLIGFLVRGGCAHARNNSAARILININGIYCLVSVFLFLLHFARKISVVDAACQRVTHCTVREKYLPLTNRAMNQRKTNTHTQRTSMASTHLLVQTMRFVYRRWRAHMRHTGFASWCVCRSRRKGRPKWEWRFGTAIHVRRTMWWWQ